MNKSSYFLAGTLAGALALTGCGDNTQTSRLESDAAAAKTATVTLSVSFPQAAGSKALISSTAQAVAFRYCPLPAGYYFGSFGSCDPDDPATKEVMVDRDHPTTTVQLSPGRYAFEAATFADVSFQTMIDHAQTAGEIVEGANTVKMTFLQGDWTFRLATGAGDPITLGDGTVLSGFKLMAFEQGTAAAAHKAGFDGTKPLGSTAYAVTLKTSLGELPAGWLGVVSQFHSGSDNNTTLMGLEYNLTQGCSEFGSESCPRMPDDWYLFMLGSRIVDEAMYSEGVWSLVPPSTLTDASGSSVDQYGNGGPIDGTTIVADLVDYQVGNHSESLVVADGAAAKAAAAALPRSRTEALRQALAAHEGNGDTASKGVTTQTLGTVTNTWYDPVIAAPGVANPDWGTWNFPEGCLVTDDPNGVYATCGYLTPDANGNFIPGDFSWGLTPTNPNNLGEYDSDCSQAGIYEPWCFSDQNGDGTVDTGSFQFTHYLRVEQTLNNVRKHTVTATGVELPATQANIVVE